MYRNFAPRKRNKAAPGHPGPVAKQPKPKYKRHNREDAQRMRDDMVALCKTPASINGVATHFGIKHALAAYHLQILRRAGKLKTQGRGSAARYVQV